jgi:hypothetical protein
VVVIVAIGCIKRIVSNDANSGNVQGDAAFCTKNNLSDIPQFRVHNLIHDLLHSKSHIFKSILLACMLLVLIYLVLLRLNLGHVVA